MVLLHPIECIADEEVLDLVLAVIKYLGAPVRVFPLPGVRIFKKGFAVKVRASLGKWAGTQSSMTPMPFLCR